MAKISVHLTPRGGRDAIERWDGDVLRARVSAAPAGGKANDALVQLIARTLGIPPSCVSVVGGAASRRKVIEISEMSAGDVRSALGG